MKYSLSKKIRKSRLLKFVVILIVIVILVSAFVYIKTKDNTPSTSDTASETTADSQDSTAPANPNKELSTNNSTKKGGAVDNNGQISDPASDSTQWSSSNSGLITLYSPIKNTTLSSGNTISGTAKVSQVSYRLIDDSVGVIASGPISVVNGKFSATVSFSHSANSGKLDIYSTDPKTGAESNEFSINLRF